MPQEQIEKLHRDHPRSGNLYRAHRAKRDSFPRIHGMPEMLRACFPAFRSICSKERDLPIPKMSLRRCAKAMKRRSDQRHAETLASIPAEEVTPEMQLFHPARLHFIELYEEEHLQRLMTDQLK